MARKSKSSNAPAQSRFDKPSPEEIASRAYTYYDQEGRIDGRAEDHWLRAEADLLRERQNGQSASPRPGSASEPRQN